MSLRDTACYTLTLIPSFQDPRAIELVEVLQNGKQESRYARVREKVDGEVYSAAIYDSLSAAKLASYGFATEQGKRRRLQLHGPDEDVRLELTGRMTFEWTFTFEGCKYRWTRELYGKDYICALDRKPDPRVEICLARGGDKNGHGQLQILHYNIDRFPDEIKDLRGLETLLVASLMCFIDIAEERNAASVPMLSKSTRSSSSAKPETPPRVISEEDFEPENPNEILVGNNTNVDEHVARACGLLEDLHVLFIVVRSRTATDSQRALEVSLGVTRYRHREGLGDLHQYVIEEDPQPVSTAPITDRPGPKVIKLDDEPLSQSVLLVHNETVHLAGSSRPELRRSSGSLKASKWLPPPNIAIYLSTIELPDLKPGRREQLRTASGSTGGKVLPEPPQGTAESKGSGSSKDGKLGRLFRTRS